MPRFSTHTWRAVIALAISGSIAMLLAHFVFFEHPLTAGHTWLIILGLMGQMLSLWLVWFGLGKADEARVVQQQQAQQYGERLGILGEVAHLLNSSLDPQTVLSTILDQLGRLVQSDSVSLLYNTATGLELVAYKNEALPAWQFTQKQVPLTPLEQAMLANKQPVLVNDTRHHPLWDKQANARPIGSWLGTPMLVNGEVVGFINLSKQEYQFYTPQDLAVVVTFASQAATAVHNAHLFERVQQELEQRKRIERALDASEQKFRVLFQTMKQGIVFRNRHGLTAINPAAEEITGLTLEELKEEYRGQIQWNIFDETGQPIALDQYPTSIALRTGQPIYDKLLYYYNPRKQVYRWVLVDAVPLYEGGEEKPSAAYAILKDVTESKQYEKALRESENRFRTLFETISHGVVYYDAQGQILASNPAAKTILGDLLSPQRTERDSFVFDPSLRVIGEDGQTLRNYPDLVHTAFISGRRLHNVVVGLQQRATQQIRWLRMEVVPLISEEGQAPSQVYTVFQDITAQKLAEESLRQTQKLESLGLLAGGIAHDFNNLLVALLGQSSLALQKLGDEHGASKHIQKVVQAAEHAAGLTRQMLAFSGRGQFEVKRLNLNQVVRDNVPLLQVAIPKTVQLHTYLQPNLPQVEADPSQMQQVVMNLVLNGAEAADKEGGLVTIVTGTQQVEPLNATYWAMPNSPLEPGDYVRLEIHDNGVGIPPEQQAKIFDPFFTTKVTGRGLGLAAVLGIVRGHRGGLRLHSEVGQGTTFTILLPIASNGVGLAPSAGPEVRLATADDTPLHGTVLIIDDEQRVQEALQDMLTHAGLQTLTAADGRTGLALYQQQQQAGSPIALVILDLSMPGLSGWETLAELRRLNPQVQVLLSSGYSQGEVWASMEDEEGIAFVQKPYRSQELLAAVRAILSEK